MSNWIWASLIGGTAALAAAVVVVLWQAFKHLDLKIERLGDKIERMDEKFDKKFDDQRNYFDKKFDDFDKKFDKKFDDQRNYFDKKFDLAMVGIAEITRLVAGHEARIEAQEKQVDRLSLAAFGPQQFGTPGQRHDGEHAPEPTAPTAPPSEAAAPGEGAAATAGGPEPTPPTAATAPT